MDDNAHIAYMMGAKLVKNDCPNYMCWKFLDEDSCKKLNLAEFSDEFKRLNSPTWKSLKFEEDWNKLIFSLNVAKKRLGWIENRIIESQKLEDLQDVSELKNHLNMALDFLRIFDKTSTYNSIVRFSKKYNEKFRWI